MLAGGGSRQLFRLLAQRSARAHVNSIAKPALQQLGDRLLSSRAGDSGVCCAAGGTATCADRLQAATGPHHHQQSARGFAATSYSSGGASSGGPPDPPPDSADAAASSQEAIERQSAEERQRRDGNVGSDIMSQPDPFRPQREEHENDKLLAQWEAMMEANEDPVVVLDTVLGELEDVQGIPSWEEILERGDEEEALERAARRSREQRLMEEFAEKRVRVVDRFGRSYATGKRKTSVARAWLTEGNGAITINGRPLTQYFTPLLRREDVLEPFQVTGTLGGFDVYATVKGGGLTGQAQALRHGIARALQLFNPEMRPALKAAGLLRRDSRIVERKKPGLAKARKAFQWVKR